MKKIKLVNELKGINNVELAEKISFLNNIGLFFNVREKSTITIKSKYLNSLDLLYIEKDKKVIQKQ